jgi:hypothetical protein
MPIPEGPHITAADIAAAQATWGASGGYTLPPPSPGYASQAPQAQAAAAPGATTTPAYGITDPGFDPNAAAVRQSYINALPEDQKSMYRQYADPQMSTIYAQTQGGYSYQAPGVQAPVNAYNYSTDGTGSVGVYPPGVASPAHTADVSSVAPMSASQAAPLVNQPYQYGGGSTSMGGTVPLPNQINAQNYGNSYDYQKELLWANYEDQGWDKGLAQEAFAKSLPKYQGITKGSVAF